MPNNAATRAPQKSNYTYANTYGKNLFTVGRFPPIQSMLGNKGNIWEQLKVSTENSNLTRSELEQIQNAWCFFP